MAVLAVPSEPVSAFFVEILAYFSYLDDDSAAHQPWIDLDSVAFGAEELRLRGKGLPSMQSRLL